MDRAPADGGPSMGGDGIGGMMDRTLSGPDTPLWIAVLLFTAAVAGSSASWSLARGRWEWVALDRRTSRTTSNPRRVARRSRTSLASSGPVWRKWGPVSSERARRSSPPTQGSSLIGLGRSARSGTALGVLRRVDRWHPRGAAAVAPRGCLAGPLHPRGRTGDAHLCVLRRLWVRALLGRVAPGRHRLLPARPQSKQLGGVARIDWGSAGLYWWQRRASKPTPQAAVPGIAPADAAVTSPPTN